MQDKRVGQNATKEILKPMKEIEQKKKPIGFKWAIKREKEIMYQCVRIQQNGYHVI